MAYQEILYAVDDRIATITLNRPDRLNAWTGRMDQEIRQALQAASDDDDVRVIVVTGAGRGFCAGADMAALSTISDGGAESDERRETGPIRGGIDLPGDFHRRIAYWATVPKPIIAAINGPCAGIGLVQVLFADLRLPPTARCSPPPSRAAAWSPSTVRRGCCRAWSACRTRST